MQRITHKGAKISYDPSQVKPNRKDKLTGVDAAVTVDSMDAVVELTWKYSQRVTEVTTHSPAGGDR
ncbi:hypothetical protein [Shewanella woodyi]|uniref:hypothetical protein n=1 Tax=Shewanella woodyi TaxID=60961 RepID=UPI0012F931CC|nr:hypothetical protein [Shewanella woodyi]